MPYTGFYDYNRYLNGDKSALDTLVRTYSDPLVRYAYCYLRDSSASEDVMEETFATLILRKKHFHDESHFHAYLYKVARNKSIDYLRRRKKLLSLGDFEELLSETNLEDSIMKQDRNRTLYRCMRNLTPQYRDVLYLTYLEGFSVEEVCQIMKKNKKQVYNLLSRAKATLKEILIKEGITYEDL